MTYWIDNELIIEGTPEAVKKVLDSIAGPQNENGKRCPIDFDEIVPRLPQREYKTFKSQTDWLRDYWGTDRLPANLQLVTPKQGCAHILFETAMTPPIPILKALKEQYGADVSFKLQYFNFQTGEFGQIDCDIRKLDMLIDIQRKERREIEAYLKKVVGDKAWQDLQLSDSQTSN